VCPIYASYYPINSSQAPTLEIRDLPAAGGIILTGPAGLPVSSTAGDLHLRLVTFPTAAPAIVTLIDLDLANILLVLIRRLIGSWGPVKGVHAFFDLDLRSLPADRTRRLM